MWAAVVGFLLQLLLEFIKSRLKGPEQKKAFEAVSAAQEEAYRTKSAQPVRDLWRRVTHGEFG